MNQDKLSKEIPLKIESISLLHIGSGEQISAIGEYFATTERVLFPNEKELHRAIKDSDNLDKYIEIILKKSVGIKTFDLLKDWGIENSFKIERELLLNRKNDITGKNDILHLHIKIGSDLKLANRVYLPGSSLKGAIRNALIYQHLITNKQLLQKISKELEDAIYAQNPISEIKRVWQKFENPKNQKDAEIITTLFANALRVADSKEVPDTDLVIEQVVRRSFSGNETEGFDYLMECIASNAIIESKLSLFLPHLEKNKVGTISIKDLKEIIISINNFSKANLDFELIQVKSSKLEEEIKKSVISQIERLQKLIADSENKYCVLRLGKGKTKLFQTILLALSPKLRLDILELLKKGDAEALPQSRVLTAKENLLLGWVKIEEKVAERPQSEAILSNQTIELIINETELDAYFIDTKLAEIHLNNEILTVQMINQFKVSMERYAPIKVLVKQLKKTGELNQVEIIA